MKKTLKQIQSSVATLFDEASVLSAAGDNAGAIQAYQRWLSGHGVSPLAHAVLFNLGVLQVEAGELIAAEHSYREALKQQPDFLQAAFNLGTTLEKRQRFDEALESWDALLALPNEVSGDKRDLLILALNNRGRLLETRKRYNDAEVALTRSLLLKPDQPNVIHHWVNLRQKQCSWPVLIELPGLTPAAILNAASALSMLDLSDDPALQLKAAQRYIAEKVTPGLEPLANPAGYGHKKLRIGYLSSDFTLHPVSMLIVEMLELHDRERFEVYGFCWSPNDGSALRQRVISALDVHVLIGDLSDEAAAQRIREAEIDILVDLQGLTAGARINILARRPAPIQVAYLGFPGTSGMPFIDYILCDRYVLPEQEQAYFTEKPLYLPEVFQVSDRHRLVGKTPSRAECGLPEDAFVFCAFNNNHKYTPELFEVWIKILLRVPGSVLWLLADNASVQSNLLAFCADRGIATERLIFAPRVLPPEYLARYRVADLFLDCFPFNGGTTANDALWMGLPILTCSGRAFASRMAGSLLSNIGLNELVVNSFEHYEQLAVELATQPGRLDRIKTHLVTGRDNSALFRTDHQVRIIDNLFSQIAEFEMENDVPKPKATVTKGKKLPLPKLSVASKEAILNFKVDTSWGISDPEKFSALMGEVVKLVAPGFYLGDNLFTWARNNSAFEDEAFRTSWTENKTNASDEAIAWRRYILACAAYHCVHLPGDFVECGVYMGTAIKTVMDYVGGKSFPTTFWGYDTFDTNPTGHQFQEQKLGMYERVLERFDGYAQVNLVKGLLPQSLEGNSPEKIAYLHIDLNSSEYEIAVLDALFDRVVPGGVIILDDYEWAGVYREQKIIEDQWFDARGYRVFPLPTGQGIVLKR